MNEANPIALSEDLGEVLRRYIATALPISRRYPKLAARFRQVLAEQTLVEGPFVEALPDFDKGKSIADLLRKHGGFLHDAFGTLPTATRRLHLHQQRALELAIRERKSLLVATGTGSGKTETFLYPIAASLLSDPAPEQPGVRALLVYPMNALANDQLYYRIAPLFARYLGEHGITFGRYTGQIRAGTTRSEEEARLLNNAKLMKELGYPHSIPQNWLLTRDEMLRSPPKVLITNYAMLEHLLLLPRNASLFAGNTLRFIVLDEIHTYRGAQATEVAFLLRKLKNRLGLGRPLQVFGTSASLAEGVESEAGLKRFAGQLFGEDVHEVVRGRRIVHERLREAVAEFSLSLEQWVELGALLEEFTARAPEDQTTEAWNGLLDNREALPGILRAAAAGAAGPFLEQCFAANKEIRRLAHLLDKGGVWHFKQLAATLFNAPGDSADESRRHKALSAVIRMGMVARAGDNAFPLLPGRYHFAVNSIEGLAVLPSADAEGWRDVKAARTAQTDLGTYFPLLTCRRCGQPFLEGWEQDETLHNRRPDPREGRSRRRVFWLGTPVAKTEDEEDEADANKLGPAGERLFIDVRTGAIGATDGAVPLHMVDTEEDEEEKAHYVKKCPACGGRSVGAEAEIVTRMHPGDEALGTVVAQRVLESLPAAAVDYADPRPAQGRSLLTFSDNRQDAAFFAPYFERTAANIALRSAVRQALRGRTAPVTVQQLAEEVFNYWQQDGRQPILLDSDGGIRTDRQDVTRLLRGAIGYEFCTPGGRRNSLEALGVVAVSYDEGKLRPLRERLGQLVPVGLPRDAGAIDALVHFLLDSIRRDRALSRLYDVPMNDEFVWGDYNQHRTFDIEGGDDRVMFRWLPRQEQRRHNRRTWYLVEQLGLSGEAAAGLLRAAWDILVRPPVAMLVRHMPGFALDGNVIRLSDGERNPLYACRSCGLMQQHVVANKCTAFGCRGEVERLSEAERQVMRSQNHYLASYEETSHVTMRAREHTASLSAALRESIEQEFADRKLNLLSCTTTMEMGVDLGDLEAVINLNVPPGIANYQQRTGRAGRRAQAAPFCVTVAKNSNYDQATFRRFRDYLQDSPRVPFISLSNPTLFERHQLSVLLSHFLRGAIAAKDINAPSLRHFLGDVFDAEAKQRFLDRMFEWLGSSEGQLAFEEAEQLANRLPDDARDIARRGAYLRNAFVGAIQEFAEEVHERYRTYKAREDEFAAARDFGRAQYWQRQRTEYMDQFLVTQLSRRGLIPTYSFPVHSVTLEVMNSRRGRQQYQGEADIALSRDASLGISEYAPGAEVVADGRIWESAGLAQYPRVFMPERWYVACPACFHVDVADTFDEVPSECTNCGSRQERRKRRFVEPRGFVTSADRNRGRDPSTTRRRAKPADEARLIAAPRSDQFVETDQAFLLTAFLPARGQGASGMRGSLFIVNRGSHGEGYFRCMRCNFCKPWVPVRENGRRQERRFTHTDPSTGQRCPNDQEPKLAVDLAHQFDTDVRLLRFLTPLPPPDRVEASTPRFHERLARTLAEALRLSATDLLDLYPGELRAIYRLYPDLGDTLEVLLYDNVAGGAGYSERLGQPGFSFSELLRRTRQRLNCPAQCDSGCRACLCDYGNQRHWDSFDRRPALAWLDNLLDPGARTAGPGNYVRWTALSLGGLSERLRGYDQVSAVANSLVESELDDASLNLLLEWLHGGKSVQLYLLSEPVERPRHYAQLTAYRHLYPYAQDGRLKVFYLPEAPADLLGRVPRLFASLESGAALFRQCYPVQPLLASLLSAPAEIGAMDQDTRNEIEKLLQGSKPCSPSVFREGGRMALWEYAPGQERDLEGIFKALKGAHVKRLTIRDPYCGIAQNRPRLRTLLETIVSSASTVEEVLVHCREIKDRNGDIEFRHDVARHIEALIETLGVSNGRAFVKGVEERSRAFHDREVSAVVVEADGQESEHRYFLTGGVDFLLDKKSETRVFYLGVEK